MIQKTSDNNRPYDYTTMDDVISDITTLFQNSSEGGSQGLSETLATGNETDGNNIVITDGDIIESDTAITLNTPLTTISNVVPNVITGQFNTTVNIGTFQIFNNTNNDNTSTFTTISSLNDAGDYIYIDLSNDTLNLYSDSGVINLILAGLPTYEDNADAITGDLTADMVYKTSTGELRIVV